MVKLCIKVNVKTRKMCNLQGVSFYSLLQWRLSTTVSQPRLRSAWKLMCSAGPYQASLTLLSPSPALPWPPPSYTPSSSFSSSPPPGQTPDRFIQLTFTLWDLPLLQCQFESCQPTYANLINPKEKKCACWRPREGMRKCKGRGACWERRGCRAILL